MTARTLFDKLWDAHLVEQPDDTKDIVAAAEQVRGPAGQRNDGAEDATEWRERGRRTRSLQLHDVHRALDAPKPVLTEVDGGQTEIAVLGRQLPRRGGREHLVAVGRGEQAATPVQRRTHVGAVGPLVHVAGDDRGPEPHRGNLQPLVRQRLLDRHGS